MSGTKTAEERIAILTTTSRKLADDISNESKRLAKSAKTELLFFRWLNSIFAILGVAAPTILASYKNTPNSPWVMVGIILAASTGAWTAIQAINRWADRYKSNFMAAHQLAQLATECEMLLDQVASANDPLEEYRLLKDKMEDAPKRFANIQQALVGTQLTFVDKAMEETKQLSAQK